MKIEVTFQKSAKRQFKEECVRRLKLFVSQIEEIKKNNESNSKRESISSPIKENIYQKLNYPFERQNKIIIRENKKNNSTMISSTVSDLPQQKHYQKFQFNKPTLAKQNKQEQTIELETMRDNVESIMKKYEQMEIRNYSEYNRLEKKIGINNKKIAQVMQVVQEISGNQAFISPQSFQSEKENDFDLKFKMLQKRYQKVKRYSVINQSQCNKEVFSPNSTLSSIFH